ncbi:MAG: prepilin-type N-terminal cleavage/methylation domain-containing protein [Myxococcota bacterium]
MIRKAPKTKSSGFSVVEALVAAAILGVALLGVVRLHGSSIRGTAQAERIGRASEVARQFAEMLATTTPGNLPACGPGRAAPPTPEPAGCKAAVGVTTAFAAPQGPGCTFWVQGGPSTPSINNAGAANGAIVAQPPPGAGGPPPSQYRIDLSVSGHPDLATFPNATVITVWACWRDESQTVNEVRTRRILF